MVAVYPKPILGKLPDRRHHKRVDSLDCQKRIYLALRFRADGHMQYNVVATQRRDVATVW
jgi:hypothetical protein